MSFGSNIGYLRKKQGITQEELAERMYVSRQTISRWETDSVYPDVETVIKLCEILECDMETLVRGDATQMDVQEPGTQEKQDVECVKRKNAKRKSAVDWDLLNAAFCSIVFLVAVPAYLVMGFMWHLWHPGWLIFVAATVLCGISSIMCTLVYKNIDK